MNHVKMAKPNEQESDNDPALEAVVEMALQEGLTSSHIGRQQRFFRKTA